MGLTGKQWRERARKLSPAKRAKLIKAIKTLKEWKAFDEQYGWTGYETIGYLIRTCEDED